MPKGSLLKQKRPNDVINVVAKERYVESGEMGI